MNNEDVTKELESLNKIHVFIYRNGKSEILNFRKNKAGIMEISFSTKRDFELYYANREYFYEGKKESLGKIWLRWPGRNVKYYIDFLPGRQTDDETVNLWQGFAIDPKPGLCDRYLNHIHEVIASGDDALYKYLLDYMADAIQNPDKKPGVALVLQSDQGAGKGIFVDYFSKIFGTHAAYVTNAKQIFDKFNAILSNKLLVFLDEGLWSGDKQLEGNLKALITSDRVTIERKGFDPVEERNFVRLIVASNNDWVFPIGRKERRGCVIGVSGHRIGDRGYFKAIADEMENGGTEALLQFLLDRDLTGVDIRDYPQTAAFEDQMENSFDAFEGWWYGRLKSGSLVDGEFDGAVYRPDWTSPVPANVLFDEFDKAAKGRALKHHLSPEQFGKNLKKFVPNLVVTRPGTNGFRKKHYTFPSLDACRENFNKVQGFDFKWND
jgi:hypothetical protein